MVHGPVATPSGQCVFAGEVVHSPLTCQMLTIFSMAQAKYFPVRLQARGDKQGSLGEPRPVRPSSEDPLLGEKQRR